MSLRSDLLINLDGMSLFSVKASSTAFTVPDSVNSPSPIGISSGVSPSTIFDVRRNVSRGMIYGVYTDQAGNGGYDFQYALKPGDVVSVAAVASNAAVVSVNSKPIYVIKDTTITVAGLLGIYG